MTPLLIALAVVAGIAFIAVLWAVGIYNGLIGLRNETKNSWSQIDVQLKRRHDLIPNLVETVRGYASHERQTLEGVIQARNQAMGASNVSDRIKAEAGLSGALGKMMLLVEQYPDLKANQNFLALQEELSSTENKIAFSRQYYNDTVMRYNTSRETFPANIVSGAFHFEPATSFQVSGEAERQTPQVKF